ncbi:MAG: PepSY domain-containing protein [Rhodospirillales bacterium]
MNTTTHDETSNIRSVLRRAALPVAAIAAVLFFAPPSWAGGTAQVLTPQKITQRLLDKGYAEVIRMEMEDGLYEVKVKTKDGKRRNLNVDPRTGEILGKHKDGFFSR